MLWLIRKTFCGFVFSSLLLLTPSHAFSQFGSGAFLCSVTWDDVYLLQDIRLQPIGFTLRDDGEIQMRNPVKVRATLSYELRPDFAEIIKQKLIRCDQNGFGKQGIWWQGSTVFEIEGLDRVPTHVATSFQWTIPMNPEFDLFSYNSSNQADDDNPGLKIYQSARSKLIGSREEILSGTWNPKTGQFPNQTNHTIQIEMQFPMEENEKNIDSEMHIQDQATGISSDHIFFVIQSRAQAGSNTKM